jgi:hypothetical protein
MSKALKQKLMEPQPVKNPMFDNLSGKLFPMKPELLASRSKKFMDLLDRHGSRKKVSTMLLG